MAFDLLPEQADKALREMADELFPGWGVVCKPGRDEIGSYGVDVRVVHPSLHYGVGTFFPDYVIDEANDREEQSMFDLLKDAALEAVEAGYGDDVN